jgi:hypothetical protein
MIGVFESGAEGICPRSRPVVVVGSRKPRRLGEGRGSVAGAVTRQLFAVMAVGVRKVLVGIDAVEMQIAALVSTLKTLFST